MIPILYEKDEAAFISNGLGRLLDCISCVVTEERNGIYECDFEYPVSGANADLIQIGRIIGVTHDETNMIQPFDIVSYEKPIDGVVTWHCVHISYRQSYITVTGSNINSLADAFTLLGTGVPSNPFTYTTDKTSTAYFAAANGLPHSVREMLGGMEGSILDAYGGEYEWDKWEVKLHSARGRSTDFSIRYGVNMTDFNDSTDSQGHYSACVPYWSDGTTNVVGDMVSASGTTITGRGECVPLDVSEKFESQPTKAQVEAAGVAYMNSNNTYVSAQNITVEFLRLQDVGEFGTLQTLMQCRLCDTVTVIFPDYQMQGTFKIVKTVWDVLQGRYESMELGTLSVSLAEALNISTSGGTNYGGGGNFGNEYTYIVASSGITGGLRLFKDKSSGTIRGYGYFRRSTNISQSETIFQLPTGWRPSGGWEIPMFFYTSGGLAAAYYGILSADGTIKQSLGSTIREGYMSFEYTL